MIFIHQRASRWAVACALASCSLAQSGLAHSNTLDTAPAPAAESDPQSESTVERPDIIVTASNRIDGYQAAQASAGTRTEAPLVEVPQAVSVVTQALLQDRQPLSLDEALATVSGVKQGNTLGGTQDAIMKRGFGTNRDNSILRDGVQSVRAHNFTPTAERVEVLKGPSSMLYGVQDPGGIVNIVTKKPTLDPLRAFSAWGTTFGGGGVQGDVSGAIGHKGLAYRLIGDWQQYDYWRNFGVNKQWTIAPSLAWYGDKTSVVASYEHMTYSSPFDRGTQLNTATGKVYAIPRERRLDEPYNITAGTSDNVGLRVEHRISPDWKLALNYGFSHNYYNDFQARTISVAPTTGVVTRRGDATRNARQTAHVVQANAVGHAELLGMKHEILVGADYMHNERVLGDLMRDATNTNFNLYSPVYGVMKLPSTVSAKDSDQTDKLHEWGLFLQDSIHLTDSWILLAGVRYDHVDELTGKGRPFVVGTKVNTGKAVPRVGLVHLFTPQFSVYGSYTQSFRPNTSIATPIGTLPPEEGKSWEGGAKYVTGRVTATAALYNIIKRNVQVSDTAADGTTTTRAAGKVRSRGVELDVSGRIGRSWNVTASYALTDTKVLEDPLLQGNPLDGVSKHQGSLFVTRDFGQVGRGKLRIGGGARIASKWGAGDGTGKEYWLPASQVFDGFMAYSTRLGGKAVEFQVNVKNIFDETYYVSNSGTTQPAIVIGEPRSAMFKARLFL
ncbi:TonB-dependent siderophore receptor [Novosphingobium terrae]|uniref:TonB-dependent siderophore receptor n=1 Tax=Novosphingobium terrae TaxID=2726189 RepID=UPI0019826916|nr:TonB-dependent receptor [Novosphingobium terrae]